MPGSPLQLSRLPFVIMALLVCAPHTAIAAQGDHEGHATIEAASLEGPGREMPGMPFKLFVDRGMSGSARGSLDHAQADAAIETVQRTFALLLQHRSEYSRFDETVQKDLLERVMIEPTVINREGKAFPFLVARTAEEGKVRLLISAAFLKERGYLGAPDKLAPVLAREFQWVVSKADTSPKQAAAVVERDLARAPIRNDQEIQALSGEERVLLLQQLFDTYLRTIDDQRSLDGQSYYETGSRSLVPPSQPDSTTKWYDIKVREALQQIVREPSFMEKMPLAVKSVLNGAIWTVTFVKIDQRDWATRTRVLPPEKAVTVGAAGRRIQSAAILVNAFRTAAPDDPFSADTKNLPMGALTAEQLALVIAKEIQQNLVEKSQTGHVAQDALSAPK